MGLARAHHDDFMRIEGSPTKPARSHQQWLRDNKRVLQAGNRRMRAADPRDLRPFMEYDRMDYLPDILDAKAAYQEVIKREKELEDDLKSGKFTNEEDRKAAKKELQATVEEKLRLQSEALNDLMNIQAAGSKGFVKGFVIDGIGGTVELLDQVRKDPVGAAKGIVSAIKQMPDVLKSIPDLPAKLAAEFEAIGKLPPEERAEALGRALGNLGFALVPVTAVAGGAAKALKITRVVKGAKRVLNVVPKGKSANHLFKGAGKLADTPANRTLIQKISNRKALGVDVHGKSWYTGVNSAGKSIYSYTRNGVVKGAGYMNMTPAEMITKYGLK